MTNEELSSVSGEAEGEVSVGGEADAPSMEGGSGSESVDALMLALKPKQQLVMQGIVATGSVVDTAKATGVGKRTIFTWLKRDDCFRAAFNAWKRDMMMLSRAQMVALAQPCVNAVRMAVDKGDARLAFAVGKSIGVFAPPKLGPDEPDEVAMMRARKAKTKKLKAAKAEREAMEEAGEKVGIAQTIYEIDELIERLMRERIKALKKEDANEKERREANQRVLREGDGVAERIARAVREASEGEVHHGDTEGTEEVTENRA